MNKCILFIKKTTLVKKIRLVYYRFLNKKYYLRYLKKKKNKIEEDGIILITHNLNRAGAPVLLLYIARYLYENNIPFVVMSLEHGPLFDDFAKYSNVYIKRGYIAKIFFKKMHKKKYTRCICNTVVSGNYCGYLKREGYSVITLIHEMENYILEEKLENNCLEIISNSDYVVFPSNYVYESFLKCINNTKFCYRIKHQGLFLIDEITQTKEESVAFIEEKYGINLKNKKIVINVATACHRKGFDLFIQTLNNLYKKDKNIFFIWVGDNTEVYLKNEKNKIDLECLNNLLLPGYIKDKELIKAIYNCSDLLYLTSREEPFGSIVLEAFSAGTPVIAFNGCGGYMDIVKKDYSGELINKFDIEDASTKIIKLVNDNSKMEYLSKNCKLIAKSNNFSDYCCFLLNLLNEGGKNDGTCVNNYTMF